MKNLKEETEFFIKKIEYIIPVIITAILSFGFVITHYSVNGDTLSDVRYFQDCEILAQGRYGGVLLEIIFGIMEYNPFFVDCLAVIFLIIASITFCILFKNISKNKINMVSYTIFSCLFISYPLINEIFVFTPMSFGICFSFFIVAVVLNLLYSYRYDKKTRKLIYSSLLLCLVVSIYESSAIVCLLGIGIIEILDLIFNNTNKKVRETLENAIIMAIPLLLSIIINGIISKIIVEIYPIKEGINWAQKEIYYKELGIIGGLENLFITMFFSYGINGLFYLPITIMQISCGIMIVMAIMYGIRKKNITIFLLFVGSICSIFSLSILQGNAVMYRTCQVFQLFVAFAFMLIVQYVISTDKSKIVKYLFICISFLIVFYQAKDLNKYFYLNYVRYEQEKTTLVSMAEKLINEYDVENKFVIFLSNYQTSNYIMENAYIKTDTIRGQIADTITNMFFEGNTMYSREKEYANKPIESNINSYLNWGVLAFRELNTEIFKWLDMLGYDNFKQGNIQMIYEIIKQLDDKAIELQSNNIIEYEDYIVAIL